MKAKIRWIFVIIIIICTYTINIYAATTSDVENLKQQKENANNELKEIQTEKKSALDEVATINSQLDSLQNEIDSLQSQLDNLNNSINAKQAEIEENEKEIEEKEKLLKKRLVSMYIHGQTSYLDVILGSGNYLEMMMNYDAVKEIADADTELINTITEKKKQNEQEKVELEEKKKEVDAVKAQKDAKSTELKEKQAEKNKKVSELTADEKEKQAQIDEFNNAIKEAEAEIRRAAEEAKRRASTTTTQATTGTINNSSGNLGWPLPLQYARYAYITSYFGRRAQPTAGASTNHGAIDIGVSYQPVYAAESGIVITAQSVSGYGNFIMIWHKSRGELYTCYAHLSQYLVSAGMTVSRGQQIAVSGNTGISTGPHLHFEVRLGGSSSSCRVDPLNYVSIS